MSMEKEGMDQPLEQEQTELEAAAETEETAAEELREEPAVREEKKENWQRFKTKTAEFFEKVKPVVIEEEEEELPQEEPQEEAPVEEEAAQAEAPVEEEPAPAPRRKPADAFIIDFPVEEPEAPAEETEETEEAAEETAEATQEAGEEEIAEEEPATPPRKKLTTWQWSLIACVSVVLVGLLAAFVLKGAGVKLIRENDVRYKDSYTADASTLESKADTVVATIADKELTVGELQLYYMNGIYTFYSQNYSYMSYMGLDLTQPLDEQECLSEDMTWEQYFLDAALQTWQSYTLVEMMAQQEGFVVSAEAQQQIDEMSAQLDSIAEAYGYASAAEYLDAEMAPGVDPETYVHFNQVYYVANEYITDFYTNRYPNDKDITLYYKENQALFEENGVTRDMGLISSVRHILIQPQGGVTDEAGETTYSEDEWATALSEAERIVEQWYADEATEESFATLANTYSADGGSNTTGGLYEDIHIDASYVPEFKNWAIDFTRKPGDVEIVKTQYGYHIMYFVSGENYFQRVVGEQLVAERIQNRVTELKEEYPMEVAFRKIHLCESNIG